MTTKHLPFFVYGTLRPGQGNWAWALQGRTLAEVPATFHGGDMYSQGGFPYVVPNPDGGDIVGNVMYVSDADYADILGDLDTLEGYRPGSAHNLYDRIVANVTLENGETEEAYVYVVIPDRADHVRALPPIPTGDWMDYVDAYRR